VLAFVRSCKSQVYGWGFASLLDESVEQYHSRSPIYIKQHTRNAIVRQISSNLIDSVTKRTANRHSQWPTELDSLNVGTDPLPVVIIGQRFQPVLYGLAPSLGPIEKCRYTLPFRDSRIAAHRINVPYTVHIWKPRCSKTGSSIRVQFLRR